MSNEYRVDVEGPLRRFGVTYWRARVVGCNAGVFTPEPTRVRLTREAALAAADAWCARNHRRTHPTTDRVRIIKP